MTQTPRPTVTIGHLPAATRAELLDILVAHSHLDGDAQAETMLTGDDLGAHALGARRGPLTLLIHRDTSGEDISEFDWIDTPADVLIDRGGTVATLEWLTAPRTFHDDRELAFMLAGALMATGQRPDTHQRLDPAVGLARTLLHEPLRLERVHLADHPGTMTVVYRDGLASPHRVALVATTAGVLHYDGSWKHQGRMTWIHPKTPGYRQALELIQRRAAIDHAHRLEHERHTAALSQLGASLDKLLEENTAS